MHICGDISICYSGGLDSTSVAFIMAKYTQVKIHLLTFIHNYGLLFPHWSGLHVRDLKYHFGEDRIIHSYHNITEIFNRITLNQLFKDWWQYGGHFIWCLGCSLAMATRTITYNLEHGIPNAMLCSSLGGEYAVMSMPVTRAEKKKFYKEYAIEFSTPLLELGISKPEERKVLKENGFWLGYRLRRGHHGVEPICIPGLQHIRDILFDLHTNYNSYNVQRFIVDKKVIMKSIIETYFKEKNMDLHSLIEKINRQRKMDKVVEIKVR